MQVSIRKFEEADVQCKVAWINDPANNRYLHYDLPLEYEKTLNWFRANQDRMDRYDATILVDGVPVGVIGLLGIDRKNGKAEYYITMGDRRFSGKGVATIASSQLLAYAFGELGLNRGYLYTEKDNVSAQKLFARIGFRREGLLKNDLFFRGHYIDRYVYGVTKEQFEQEQEPECLLTPILHLGDMFGNDIYMKRDDMIPFSFGGNKARKARLFFQEIDAGDYDTVVTYGSGSSNHCRIVANMAAARNMGCVIISAEETAEKTFNSELMTFFGAEIKVCPVTEVHDTIERAMDELCDAGRKPYFIPGGGHGKLGTAAYVECYDEIASYEAATGLKFDYIFFASGTGATHAGLVCGKLMRRDKREIVGISIARCNPRGRQVVVDSVAEYMDGKFSSEEIDRAVEFCDEYILSGYGDHDADIDITVETMMTRYGIPMDTTYTGKAFCGMQKYLREKGIVGKKILFIHTGGTPLFFEYLKEKKA